MAQAERLSPDEPPDADLVRRIQAGGPGRGDRVAETLLYKRYQDRIRLMLRERTRNHALAEDLTHDAFIILIKQLRSEGLREPSRVWFYLHATAHNVFIAWVRKCHTRPQDDLSDDLPNLGPGPDDEANAQTVLAVLIRVIKELPVERDRMILYLYWVEEKDHAEICAILHLDPAHEARVLHRANQRFRELLEEHGIGPDDLRAYEQDAALHR